MTWKLDGIRILVEDDSGWIPTPRKGQIDLLDTNYSIIHEAGRESHKRNLTFVVLSGYYENILPIANKSSVTLEDDSGTTTSVSVLELEPERLYDYKQREIHRVQVNLMQVDT